MRVTNHMIFGNSMNNIWRNARHLNGLVTQIETGKQIQRPSDDPLLSARTLRYRTILSETEQFLRNAQQGMAWMEVSEASFNSILTGSATTPSLMQRIYTRLVEGAQTGTQTLEEHRAIVAELRQYFNQMFGVDMNQTYLGRYVFSGFHTDQPPVLKEDWPGRSFIVSQEFNPNVIERAKAFYRPTHTSMPEYMWANIIKLPFTNVDFEFNVNALDPADPPPIGEAPATGIFLADGTRLDVITIDSTVSEAYRPEGLVVHHLRDTGELIVSDELRDLIFASGGLRVAYEKNNLVAGELNPIVYFESTEVLSLERNADGEIIDSEAVRFNTRGHNIQMEISPMSYITINTHARDTLTADLFADLRRLFDFVDSLTPSDPGVIREYLRTHGDEDGNLLTGDALDAAVARFLSDERAAFAGAVHLRFDNMLRTIKEHTAQAQRQHSQLGARMARLEMVTIRLQEDEVAYTDLLSQNEDADLSAAIMQKAGAEAAFNHALRAIAMTTQLSLADFINR
ncbi:MAG: hypothetical protein FWF80_06160 [Defluviitaleaceae bacterium]|nr:hypothetical protein [Defluviitaleaceae bacterium]